MSPPKHLWSGDWERESAAVSEELAGLRAVPSEAPVPPPAPAQPHTPAPRAASPTPIARATPTPPAARLAHRTSPRLRAVLALGVAVALVVAAGAFGLTRVLGSSDEAPSATASQQGGPIDWLGMQIGRLPTGTVVIQTVAPGSSAELAGLEPGDVIVEVNGKPINSTADIPTAIASLPRGAYVEIQVSRGSTLFTTQAALGGVPSSHP